MTVDRRMSMSQENKPLAYRFLQEGFENSNLGVKEEWMPQDQCGHKLLDIEPIVFVRVEGGYAGRCLLCGVVGPVRGNGRTARVALLEQETRHEE
jgi:hypothetical protein